jgi:protein TonB
MEPLREYADQPRTWIRRRSAVATALSALLHLVLLLVFATATVQLVSEPRRDVLPLVIREPAPLPLPGAPTAPVVGPPAAVVAPVVVPPVPQPVVKAPPRGEPRPAPKSKIAAKPKPAAAPKPAPAPVAPPAAPPVAVAPEAGSGTGGAMGAPGGAPAGKAGGRLGGRGDDVFGVDQVAVRPAVIDAPRPVYPAIARNRHQEGTVTVEAVIDRSGRIESDSLRVVVSQPPFDAPALDAFRRWRFKPGRDESGTAVRVRVKLPMRFHLR